MITRFLYCLEQLGVPEWNSQFKGDFPAEFQKLDAEKRGKNTAVAPAPMALNRHMTWAFA